MNHRLLMLDDETDILDAYQAILGTPANQPKLRSSRSQAQALQLLVAAEPLELTRVTSGEQAILEVQKSIEQNRPFSGGFFDVKLRGGIDGIETIRQIKDIDPNLLCVIVTAYQDRSVDEIQKVFGEDFADRWDFLNKPFSQNEIKQKAAHLISNWDRRRREKEHLAQIESQQHQLLQSERLAAIGTLARGIGHELGNILVRIIGKSELALATDAPDEMIKALSVVVSSGQHASVILRNLQSMVRMETARDTIDIRAPLTDALDLIEHELKGQGITLTRQYPELTESTSETESEFMVHAHRVEIGQVFLNLLINAVHAVEKSASKLINIKIETDPNAIRVLVKDSGYGISSVNLEKIFEPLFTTKGEKGSGLGLSVSRKIIQNHKGTLSVVSEPNLGTTFQLQLPKRTR